MLTVTYFNAAGAFTEASFEGSYYHPVFADSFTSAGSRGYRQTTETLDYIDSEGARHRISGHNIGHDVYEGRLVPADALVVSWQLAYGGPPVMRFDFSPPITRDGDASYPGAFPMPIFKVAQQAGSIIIGNALDNEIVGNGPGDRLHGREGNDILWGLGGPDALFGAEGNDRLIGARGNDTCAGGPGSDVLTGAHDRDLLLGGSGDDVLSGGIFNDRLIGGVGADRMAGGADNDLFIFESAIAPRGDVILDFEPGRDRIDLRLIDADPDLGGDQAFSYIRKAGFTGSGAELRYRDGNLTADLDGDGLRDFHLVIAIAPALTPADLLL